MDDSFRVIARQHSINKTIQLLILGVFSAIVVVMTACLFLRADMQLSKLSNEGWNAGLVSLWLSGGPLYHPPGALITNNYPPISFIMTAAVMRLLPDALLAGRLLSGAGFVAITGLILFINRSLFRDIVAAWAGALVFAGFMVVNYDFYVAVDDPQILSLAIMLLGLAVFVAGRDGTAAPIASACIFAMALFTKHNNIALPMALGLWLLVYDRPAFLRFALAGLIASALLFLAFRWQFGPDFVSSLLAPRQYSPAKAFRDTIAGIAPMMPLIVLAVLTVVLPWRDRFSTLVGLYLVTALGIGAFALSGAGVGINTLFEVVIACALAGGQLVARLRRLQPASLRSWAVAGLAACTLLSPGIADAKDMLIGRSWFVEMRAQQARAEAMVAILRAHPGPALCETNTFCYWAGKPFALDMFNFIEALRTGAATDAELVHRITAGEYSMIQLFGDAADDPIRTPAVLAAIASRYTPIASPSPGSLLYVRRE